MDAWKELGDHIRAARDGDDGARARFVSWVARATVSGDIDTLIGSLSRFRAGLACIREVRGWAGTVDDVGRVISERKKEMGREGLRLVIGGGEGSDAARIATLLPLTRDGLPRPTLRSVFLVLSEDSRWKGRIRFNEFTGDAEVDDRPCRDADIRAVSVWLEENYAIAARIGVVHDGLLHAAEGNRYHPVKDYLNGVEWDGVSRIHELFRLYAGAPASALTSAMSMRFLISCVARIMEPGCKVDTVPILIGKQGSRKSTFVRVLAGDDWYRDTDVDPHGKSAYEQIKGAWLYEVPEIEKWNSRRDQATIKGFLTSQQDVYRPAYGRCLDIQPRQCVFVGTTNEKHVLADPTGARRYWTVRVRSVDIERLMEDRDQLWAEAVALYEKGIPWHLSDDEQGELKADQVSHQQVDPWEDHLSEWLDLQPEGGTFKYADAVSHLQIELKDQSALSSRRVSAVLHRLGWEVDRSSGKKRLWARASK